MIVEISKSLTNSEKKFLLSCISSFERSNSNGIFYNYSDEIFNICKNLNKKSVFISDNNKAYYSYLIPCFYTVSNNIVVYLDYNIFSYLKMISFYYNLGIDVFEFNNIYTFDFLAFLNKSTDFKPFNFSINIMDFRKYLNIEEDEYDSFSNFKRRVLDPLINKFNFCSSNFAISYLIDKKGFRHKDIYLNFTLTNK